MSGETEKPVVMLIFDISGYTSFFVTNHEDLKCAHAILTDLIGSIIKEVKIPLKISKLEGDAVFAYAVKDGGEIKWAKEKSEIKNKLPKFFKAFTARVQMLKETNSCGCNACKNVDALKIKIVVHSGTVFFQKIDRFFELSGPDVIILHRLLKNNVPSHEYMLVTDSAWQALGYTDEMKTTPYEETYEHLGTIKSRIYYPPLELFYVLTKKEVEKYHSPAVKFAVKLYKQLVKLLIAVKIIRLKTFVNLPQVK